MANESEQTEDKQETKGARRRPLADRLKEIRATLHRMTGEAVESEEPIPGEVESALTHAAIVLGTAERALRGKPTPEAGAYRTE